MVLRSTLRATLPRVASLSPAISWPDMVPSIDCELSYTTSRLGLTVVPRNKGVWAKLMVCADAPLTSAASNAGNHRRTRPGPAAGLAVARRIEFRLFIA